jgi:nitroreductase
MTPQTRTTCKSGTADERYLDDLVAAADLARLAPSVHNTQPWRLRVGAGRLDLEVDPARQLDVLDPDGRQLVISCGAALLHARLALRSRGLDPQVSLLPEPDGPVLARVTPRPGGPGSEEERALAAAARVRHTRRDRFTGAPVPAETLRALQTAAAAEGAWLRVLRDPDDRAQLVVLLARADALEAADERYAEELARWTRRPGAAQDGVGTAPAAPSRERRGQDLRLRDFTAGRGDAVAGDPPPLAEHDLVVVIGTEGDDVPDWVAAGQALAAVQLRGLLDGVQSSPLGQVLDVAWTRTRLARSLGVVGHPQMVLRLGFGDPGAATPRRPLEDLTG